MAADHNDHDSGGDPRPGERKHVFDDPKNVKRVIHGLLIACAIVFALDIVNLVQGLMGWHEWRHEERPWEGLPGFYAVYGFVACVLLVLAARDILRRIVMRDEDYYDR